MPGKQHTFGQFETPVEVADLLLALCLRRAGDRVLDPSCGVGALLKRAAQWQSWLAYDGRSDHSQLWGVELDEETASVAQQRLPQAHILHNNFFTLTPQDLAPPEPFDAIVGNPPYTRAAWIDRLHEEAARQLAIFENAPDVTGQQEEDRNHLIPAHLWQTDLNRRAGLHAYFFLHGARFLRDGGRFGFVMPNNWLDVDYGAALKQFLLQQFKIVALIESTVERWFAEARVNTCLVILEKCGDAQARAANLVRFIQLRQPLAELAPHSDTLRAHFSAVETLTTRLLPAQDRTSGAMRVRVTQQRTLQPREKWGMLWRAPAFYRRMQHQVGRRGLAPLKQWAAVQRGFTTGANTFFYLDDETIEKWQIEPRFRRPLLKSLRYVETLLPGAATRLEVLSIAPTASLAGTKAAAYVAWGEAQGYHHRPTCRSRKPWYVLPHQEPAPLVLAKGIWERHLAPLLTAPLLVDQQLYRIYLRPGVPLTTAAALLNSSWLALQLELQGRVNFGEGVLWLATYEVQNLLLPDPRAMQPQETANLGTLFEALSKQPMTHDLATELAREERRALDEAVFSILDLSPTEATILLETLQERVYARQAQAQRAP